MNARTSIDDLFERRITYPDVDPQIRLGRLVGLDEHKTRLTKILGLLINPAGLEDWAKRRWLIRPQPICRLSGSMI